MSNNGSRLILPSGGRCLNCANPQPCFAHSEIVLTGSNGSEMRYPNMAALMGSLIEAVAKLNARVDRLAAPRVTITRE